MDKSREIVFHLARRLLWAKRELRKYDDPRFYYAMQQRYAVWMAFNEAQNSYRVAKMGHTDLQGRFWTDITVEDSLGYRTTFSGLFSDNLIKHEKGK